MTRKKPGTGLLFTALGTVALLLAVGGLSAFSFAQYPDAPGSPRQSTRLAPDPPDVTQTTVPGLAPSETPDITPTSAPSETPGATVTTTPSETPGATPTGAQGTYMGEIPNIQDPAALTWVALNTHGDEVTAFVTDGSKDHAPTFAHWYKGTMHNQRLVAPAIGTNQGQLEATLTSDTAIGKITLPDGRAIPFTADALRPVSTGTGAGLYRAEKTVNGDDYVAGWIVTPNPTAATNNGNPSITETPALVPSVGASPTVVPSPTPAASMDGMIQGGALSNKTADKVHALPELTAQNVQAQKVTLPDLGEFDLVACKQHSC